MSGENSPYSPPESSVETAGSEALPVVPAPRWRRFANLLLDYVAITIYATLLSILVVLIFGETALGAVKSVPDFILGIPVVLSYYLLFEGLLHRSLGKFVTGTRVVNENGLAPTFGQIVGRSFARFIPFEGFSFLGSTGRGLHDSLSHTYVVMTR